MSVETLDCGSHGMGVVIVDAGVPATAKACVQRHALPSQQ